jgi:Zn-dependent protease/predicted transcriptional regulator
MKWSLPLGRLFGIPVYVHATFALLLAWIGFLYWTASGSIPAVASGIAFILALFGCVLLHELGHALAARQYGIRTRDITLLPIGGLARLERMPERPAQELWVALAGPLVNVVIAMLLLVWLLATGSFATVESIGVASGSFAGRLMIVNLFLVVFNLIPAFPMDGGRVLRALLAMRTDYARATRIAASIGQGAAVVFGLLGLISNPFLILIAVFIWFGASQESAAVQTRSALDGVPVESAMMTEFRSLHPWDPVERAVALSLAGSQRDFPVLERGRFLGILTQKRLLEVLSREGLSTSVGRVVDDRTVTVERRERVDAALERMQQVDCPMALVLEEGRMVGVLTPENVAEYLSFRGALTDGGTRGDKPRGGLFDSRALDPGSGAVRG